jgi:hypothetical protein
METRVYEGIRNVTLKDGTVKQYKTRKVYTVKPKKEVTKTDLCKKLLKVDNIDKLKRIKEIIEEPEDERQNNPDEIGGN